MKKYISIIVILLIVCGCDKTSVTKQKTSKKPEIKEEIKYVDNNTMPIAFYKNKVIQREYKTSIRSGIDIGVFQIYPSNLDTISYSKYGEDFYNTWISYDPNHNTKIGYNLSYTLSDGTNISHNILSINDTKNYEAYILVFLYDDYYNRNNSWYSHLETEDNNTFYTSIKLYPQSLSNEINSKIILTVFTYDSLDDIDPATLKYRGNSKFSLEICDINRNCQQ